MEEWLAIVDAAERCGGVDVGTLYRLINEGQVAAYRVGRVYRVRAADVDQFLARNQVSPGDLDHLIGFPSE